MTVAKGSGRRRTGWVPLLPALALLAVLLCALFLILQFSVRAYIPGSLQVGGLTLANYRRIFDPLYLGAVWETLVICFWVTTSSLLLGYPVAYALVRHRSRAVQAGLLIVVILPFFLGTVVRSYAWMLLLGVHGALNATLVGLGVIREPLRLMFSRAGVIVALVQISLPIMIILVAAGLCHVLREHEQVAATLGARPTQVFLHVTWPLSLPGVISASIVVFGWTLSAFATPVMIGGGRVYVMTVMIYDQILGTGNYPFGAALGVFVLAVDLLLLRLIQAMFRALRGGPSA